MHACRRPPSTEFDDGVSEARSETGRSACASRGGLQVFKPFRRALIQPCTFIVSVLPKHATPCMHVA